MAVTPVRTGPLPTTSLPSPEMSVVCPTSTPFTSVMALNGPVVPSNGTPRSRARGLVSAERLRINKGITATSTNQRSGQRYMRPPAKQAVYRNNQPTNRHVQPNFSPDPGDRRFFSYICSGVQSHQTRFWETTMDSWKKALVMGSIGSAALLFMKKKYPAGVLATGVGLAVLASEYPDKFEKVRRSLPDYFDRGMQVMEMAAKAGKRITEAAGRDAWDEIGG